MHGARPRLRLCVVGSSTRFLSGISYYTIRLANALAAEHIVSAIPMRQLLPARLYPGRRRVGAPIAGLGYSASIRVFPGVDWYWLPSLLGALAFLTHRRPQVVIFEWWTGTVLHTYVALALAARLLGARVVVEFHEILDPGELRLPLAHAYVRAVAPLLMRQASGFVVHSRHDATALRERYRLAGRPVAIVPHGPYDHHAPSTRAGRRRDAPDEACNLLFFGVIRPYKGLEDLVRAFDAIPESEIERYWLTIVGETWEGWTLPEQLVARSRYRDRITFVNRYVPDDEATGYFAGADAVVLPYRRSSASGPLHIAMSLGLPTIVSAVGGLVEAVVGYDGVRLVPPGDPAALGRAIEQIAVWRGQRFADPHSWDRTAERFAALFAEVGVGGGATAGG